MWFYVKFMFLPLQKNFGKNFRLCEDPPLETRYRKSTVEYGTVKRDYSGHFLFIFYFELKDIFEQSKCPQLLVTYPRMYQK